MALQITTELVGVFKEVSIYFVVPLKHIEHTHLIMRGVHPKSDNPFSAPRINRFSGGVHYLDQSIADINNLRIQTLVDNQ